MLVALASCGGPADDFLPPTQGGAGTVISLNKVDGGHDARVDGAAGTGSGGGTGGSGAGGHLGTGGVAGGRGGAGGGSTGTAGNAGAGGAGGSGPQDDPCTACEKRRCSHPAGLTINANDLASRDTYAKAAGAYEVCFVGTGWPTDIVDPLLACGSSSASDVGTVATAGAATGTAKTKLCQDILKCVHQTNCTDGEDVDNELQCLCGVGVGFGTCEAADFTPMGACASQIEAGLEVVELSTSAEFLGDLCRGYGAAFNLYEFCDNFCCSQECLGGRPTPTDDPTSVQYCNATGQGGASGSSGSAGSGGSSGPAGAGGNSGTGGATGGHSGAGGVSGAGGHAAGSGGSVGAAGAGGSVGSTLQNVHFDINTNGWMPSIGATLGRNTNDAAGNTQSGSLDVGSSVGDPTIAAQVAASQCLGVSAGATYNLGVKVLIPGQVGSQGGLGLWYYTSTDCTGAIAGVFSSPSSTTNAWQTLTATAQVPTNAHSAAVRLLVLKPIGQQSADALFDDVLVTKQ